MKKRRYFGTWRILVILALSVGVIGCDQGDDVAELKLSPESVVLTSNHETVRFSVAGGLRDLSMPLSWEVSDPQVGNIIAAEGTDAEYVRLSHGINIVMVRDQYGAEGYATVNSRGTRTERNDDDPPPQDDQD